MSLTICKGKQRDDTYVSNNYLLFVLLLIIYYLYIYVLFSYVGVCFDKLETEFIEIIHYWQIKEIACLNERLFFSYAPFFNYTIYQSTNGNGSALSRSGYNNPDDSLG